MSAESVLSLLDDEFSESGGLCSDHTNKIGTLGQSADLHLLGAVGRAVEGFGSHLAPVDVEHFDGHRAFDTRNGDGGRAVGGVGIEGAAEFGHSLVNAHGIAGGDDTGGSAPVAVPREAAERTDAEGVGEMGHEVVDIDLGVGTDDRAQDFALGIAFAAVLNLVVATGAAAGIPSQMGNVANGLAGDPADRTAVGSGEVDAGGVGALEFIVGAAEGAYSGVVSGARLQAVDGGRIAADLVSLVEVVVEDTDFPAGVVVSGIPAEGGMGVVEVGHLQVGGHWAEIVGDGGDAHPGRLAQLIGGAVLTQAEIVAGGVVEVGEGVAVADDVYLVGPGVGRASLIANLHIVAVGNPSEADGRQRRGGAGDSRRMADGGAGDERIVGGDGVGMFEVGRDGVGLGGSEEVVVGG